MKPTIDIIKQMLKSNNVERGLKMRKLSKWLCFALYKMLTLMIILAVVTVLLDIFVEEFLVVAIFCLMELIIMPTSITVLVIGLIISTICEKKNKKQILKEYEMLSDEEMKTFINSLIVFARHCNGSEDFDLKVRELANLLTFLYL